MKRSLTPSSEVNIPLPPLDSNSALKKSFEHQKFHLKKNQDLDTTPNKNKSFNRNMSYSKISFEDASCDKSPSIVYPVDITKLRSPETPDDYCPVVGAGYEDTWSTKEDKRDESSDFTMDMLSHQQL